MSIVDEHEWLWWFALGIFCLSVAIAGSTLNLPTEYEMSIFAGPPWFVWGLFLITMIVSLVLAVYVEGARSRHAGFVLSTTTAVTIAALPVLRSYYYFGRFDSLNHLGTLHDMLGGVSAKTTMYPGEHLLSAVVVNITGLSPEVALLLVTPVFVLLFALGLYSIVLQWGTSSLGSGVAGFVPLTLPFVIAVRLPKLQPIPTTVALLMFPLLLYLLFKTLQDHQRLTFCLLVLAASHVFYHPQHALILTLGIFLGNLAIQFSPFPDTTLRPRFGLSMYVGTILVVWLNYQPAFRGAAKNFLSYIGSDTGVVEGATPTGDSLREVGGSLFEVAVKVLGPKLLLITGLLTLTLYLFARLDDERLPTNKELYLLAFGLSAALFIPPFAMGYARSQMFRYIGAGLIFVTLLLVIYTSERDASSYQPEIRHVIAVLLLLSAVTALPTVYKSPYVYQSGEHVPDKEFQGYEFVFENRHERPVRALDSNPERYKRALYGRNWPEQTGGTDGEYPSTQSYMRNRTVDEANGTIVLAEYTRAKYLRLYPELGYSEAHFRYLESGRGIHKLYSNGGSTVYTGQQGSTG